MIQAGNWAHYASLYLFKNQLISRCMKFKIYETLVCPVVTCGTETWSLPVEDENALRFFERRILGKIIGPVWHRDEWRNCYNMELNELFEGCDIVRFVKAQRVRWLGHMMRMLEEQIPEKMLKG
jgi:hypothetical protein